MNGQHMSPFGFTVEEIKLELSARVLSIPQHFRDVESSPQLDDILRQIGVLSHSSKLPPLNPAFSFISTPGLLSMLRLSIKAMALDIRRGIWNEEDARQDFYEITDAQVRKNALSVAAVCGRDALHDIGSGNWELRVKHYGKMLNLRDSELFYDQPAAAGSLCSGVLVDNDVVLTVAHFTDRTNVRNLCFLFGYAMLNPTTVITQLPDENIYRGVEVLHRRKDSRNPGSKGSDWALVKLDREVKGQEIVPLSQESVFMGMPVYTIGYPCGLPLKYSPGRVAQNDQADHFMVHVDVFMGHSGSPLFSTETHEMIGLLTRTDAKDFYWTVDGRASVKYPNKNIESHGACCIRVSEFYRVLHQKGDHLENQSD